MTATKQDSPITVTPPRRTRLTAGPVLAGLALLCWMIGLRPSTSDELDSLGLLPQLSPWVLVAYPLLLAAVVHELLRDHPRGWCLGGLTALGVVLVYGLQPAVQATARLPVTWLHAGFANYIGEHGDVLHEYDARFSWPGFFAMAAFVVRASGEPDAAVLLRWAPVVLAGLAVLGVRAIAVVVLGDRPAAWIATWVFLLANWTEQDYFSPQGTTFVLVLAALALTLRRLTRPGLLTPGRSDPVRLLVPDNDPRDRLGALALVLLIAVALVPSHQLSPFVLAGLLAVLRLWGRLWPTWLPVVILLLGVCWFALAAKEFWAGQLAAVTGAVGDLSSSLQQGLGERIVGDSGRRLIVLVRIGITGFVGLLALAGLFVLRRRGVRSLVLPALGAAPFVLAVLQPYGGEIFMRCYLFSLPFLAIGAGVALDALKSRVVSVWLPLVLLATSLVAARGGNDAYTSFAAADLAATHRAYELAAPGQRVEALVSYTPLSSRRLGELPQGAVEARCPRLDELLDCTRRDGPDYLVITPPQDAYGKVYFGLLDGWTERIAQVLESEWLYRKVFQLDHSQVLVRLDSGEQR